jgi:hypothetical protein
MIWILGEELYGEAGGYGFLCSLEFEDGEHCRKTPATPILHPGEPWLGQARCAEHLAAALEGPGD